MEPGREHPGGVEHQQVPRLEQVGQVADDPVLGLDARAPVDEQPGRVALGQRVLGDALLGELVVEGGGLHDERSG